VPVGDENADRAHFSEVTHVEEDDSAHDANDCNVRVPQVVIPVKRHHRNARLRERLGLVQVGECVVRHLPRFDLPAVEASHDFVWGDLQHAVYLREVTREADQVSLDKRRILSVDLCAPYLALLPAFEAPKLQRLIAPPCEYHRCH